MRALSLFALSASLLLSLPAMAANKAAAAPAGNNITVQSVAEQEVEVKLPNGKMEKKRQPVTKAIPGSEVIFTTRFTNQGKQPAGNIVITNPVPASTTYVGGSASGDNTDITYSLDGKNYATPEKLKAKTPEGKERPALPADYSHIRWSYKGELAPSKSGEISFRVTIK